MRNILLLVFVATVFFSCQRAKRDRGEPATSGNEINYGIAFNVLVDEKGDDYDIFTMNLDGSEEKNITNHPDVAWTYLSQDHNIFFLSDRDTLPRYLFLYEMDPLGGAVNRITDFRMSDSWMGSRNGGQELIVSPHPSVDTLLYLIDRKGIILKKIAPGTPYASHPTFSPAGDRIAFVGKNKISKRDPGYMEEIYTVGLDGTGFRQLTHYPVEDTTAEWWAYRAGPPKWHPTEGFITYQSKQKGKYSLYAVSEDGSRQWKLTDNPQEEGWHDWSPDGKWLAIELFNPEQSQFHIGLMNWETKELNILTDTNYTYQQAPNFYIRQQ